MLDTSPKYSFHVNFVNIQNLQIKKL